MIEKLEYPGNFISGPSEMEMIEKINEVIDAMNKLNEPKLIASDELPTVDGVQLKRTIIFESGNKKSLGEYTCNVQEQPWKVGDTVWFLEIAIDDVWVRPLTAVEYTIELLKARKSFNTFNTEEAAEEAARKIEGILKND